MYTLNINQNLVRLKETDQWLSIQLRLRPTFCKKAMFLLQALSHSFYFYQSLLQLNVFLSLWIPGIYTKPFLPFFIRLMIA